MRTSDSDLRQICLEEERGGRIDQGQEGEEGDSERCKAAGQDVGERVQLKCFGALRV